jgi:hypothetical protein
MASGLVGVGCGCQGKGPTLMLVYRGVRRAPDRRARLQACKPSVAVVASLADGATGLLDGRYLPARRPGAAGYLPRRRPGHQVAWARYWCLHGHARHLVSHVRCCAPAPRTSPLSPGVWLRRDPSFVRYVRGIENCPRAGRSPLGLSASIRLRRTSLWSDMVVRSAQRGGELIGGPLRHEPIRRFA